MTTTFAPGRVEILGNHTDYNEGVVLSAALELGVRCTGRSLPEDRIELSSDAEERPQVFGLEEIDTPNATWTDYPLGVTKCFREAGLRHGGFSCRFESTLPSGAGLSSSAALEVATAAFLCAEFDFPLDRLDLARICRKAENEFVGVNCGLLDQVSSVFGKKDHLVFLDCRAEIVETIPVPDNLELLILHSGVKHALTGGEYNERREQCFTAAELLGVRALRDTTPEAVEAANNLPDVVRRRALHITGENRRVFAGRELLAKGDLHGFGKLLLESHESSRVLFENSTPELDVLVSLAARTDGVYGSRLTGGGFGGATVCLVEAGTAERAATSIVDGYRKQTGNQATPFVCHIGDGARSLPAEPNGSDATHPC